MGCLWQGIEAMFRGLTFPFYSFSRLRWFRLVKVLCAVVSFILFARLVLVSTVSRLRWFRARV